MARIDDLISQVTDDNLRAQLTAAAKELRRQKRFGLVFEEHIPETVLLASESGVRVGAEVMLRREPDDKTRYTITKVTKTTAHISDGSETRSVKKRDLLVVVTFGDPVYPVLRAAAEPVVRSDDRPFHTVINGENFHALQLLLFAYEGQVDCIYIDPPYNTGARDWKYNNDYVDENDTCRHSKWLSMMEKRLRLAKKLLNPYRSVLIVTIDEKEYLHLGMLLEQVFTNTAIQMVTSCIKPSGSKRSNEFSRVDEYLFFVMLGAGPVDHVSDMLRDDRDHSVVQPITWQGLRRRGSTDWKRAHRPNGFYPIYIKDGNIHSVGEPIASDADRRAVNPPNGCWVAWPLDPNGQESRWQINPKRLRLQLADGTAALASADEESGSCSIVYLKSGDLKRIADGEVPVTGRYPNGRIKVGDATVLKRPKTMWVTNSHDASAYGTALLTKFVGNRNFPFPKSLYAVEDAIRFFVADKPEALVLDFFSGSGTTAHAVARLNRQDGGRRRSISITNNEVSSEERSALVDAGLSPGDEEWENHGIFRHVAVPRIVAAFTGYRPDGTPIPGDYKFTDEFPMAEGFNENAAFFDIVYEDPDSIEVGSKFEDVLPTLWLAAGAEGNPEDLEVGEHWFLMKGAPFAVLLDEDRFVEFADEVRKRGDLTHVWLVTNSTSAFARMRQRLPKRLKVGMLYRDYLRNFRINTGAVS